jgi:hypothetical protein
MPDQASFSNIPELQSALQRIANELNRTRAISGHLVVVQDLKGSEGVENVSLIKQRDAARAEKGREVPHVEFSLTDKGSFAYIDKTQSGSKPIYGHAVPTELKNIAARYVKTLGL